MNKHITQTIDGISIRLKQKHDFSWIKPYGKVFKIYDTKDSGNILFGVEKNNEKHFIKYAGAYTLDYEFDAKSAVERLKQATRKYDDIKHDALISLISHREIGNGYIAVFKWEEGECLHDYWMFEKRCKYNNQKDYSELVKYQHKDAPMYKFKNLQMEKRINAYRIILDFINAVHKAGYQAIDFNDNQIMYDFTNDILRICDIDFFEKKPYENTGHIFYINSERFRSPEEYKKGDICDEITNIYHLGIFAFVVFGHELDKTLSTWNASKELYDFANKAISPDRKLRYQSVLEMITVFKNCIKDLM